VAVPRSQLHIEWTGPPHSGRCIGPWGSLIQNKVRADVTLSEEETTLLFLKHKYIVALFLSRSFSLKVNFEVGDACYI
jgi:hypothetical protein